MADINQVIQKAILSYRKKMQTDDDIQNYYKKISKGSSVSLNLANRYSARAGDIVADVYKEYIAEIPDTDDQRKLYRALCDENYSRVNPVFEKAQKKLNEDAGVGLKAIGADKTKSSVIDELVNEMIASGADLQDAVELARNKIRQMSQDYVDNGLKKNAEFQSNSGMEVLVTREYDGVGAHTTDKDGGDDCQWCLIRCGVDVPYAVAKASGMFERHPGCGCIITYKSAKTTQQGADWTWREV